jgi:hypothetical protein
MVRLADGLDCGPAAEAEAEATEGAGSAGHTSCGASGELRVRPARTAHIMHADSDLDIRSDSQPSSRHNLTSQFTLPY